MNWEVSIYDMWLLFKGGCFTYSTEPTNMRLWPKHHGGALHITPKYVKLTNGRTVYHILTWVHLGILMKQPTGILYLYLTVTMVVDWFIPYLSVKLEYSGGTSLKLSRIEESMCNKDKFKVMLAINKTMCEFSWP